MYCNIFDILYWTFLDIKMLRAPQYTKEQRVFMVNKKTMGESTKVINYEFKKCFPFSGRDPGKCIILKNKKKFDKEGIIFFYNIYMYWTSFYISKA